MSNYFFCYSKTLHRFLHERYNIQYICAAYHETTHKKFWLYERTELLKQAQEEYKNLFTPVTKS